MLYFRIVVGQPDLTTPLSTQRPQQPSYYYPWYPADYP